MVKLKVQSARRIIHKIKIVLKELRETFNCLKIIKRANLYKTLEKIDQALSENNELISIFVKSVETAQRNIDTNKL
jgi:four helix bundle protein